MKKNGAIREIFHHLFSYSAITYAK
jgi:hypothetical protein